MRLRRTAAIACAVAGSAGLVGVATPAVASTGSSPAARTTGSTTAKPTAAPAASTPAWCRRSLDRAVDAYVATTDARDAAAFERLMDRHYTVVLPGGTTFVGKKAGSAFIDHFFARTDWTQTFRLTSTSVVGCATATTVFASTYTDEDGAVPLVIGLTWTRHDGRWFVLLDQNTVVDS